MLPRYHPEREGVLSQPLGLKGAPGYNNTCITALGYFVSVAIYHRIERAALRCHFH